MIPVFTLAAFLWTVVLAYIFRGPIIRSIQSVIQKGSKIDE